jgi:hypothetical protein
VSKVVFSPDGKRLAFLAVKGGSGPIMQVVVVDGKEGTPHQCHEIMGPVFSPDSRHVAYTMRRNDAVRLFVDGKEAMKATESFHWHEAPVFSPDGKHVAARLRLPPSMGFNFLIVDDAVHKFDAVGPPVFDASGSKVAFGVMNDDLLQWKVIDLGK